MKKPDIQQLKRYRTTLIKLFSRGAVSVASGILVIFRSMGGLYDEISKDGQSPRFA